jgi:hypothetical protein
MSLDDLARRRTALEPVDVSPFQRRARVLQSIWREEQGFACGEHRRGDHGRPLGSRLAMPWAEDSLANFLTDRIREVVRREVCDSKASRGKLFAKPRIFNDLLSSQPLCFNLFAELSFDLGLASHLVRGFTGERFREVRSISFEHSFGRGDCLYLCDRSAFDVFLECTTSTGGRGFVGIEVKYHENFHVPPGKHRKRYDEVAKEMACFGPGTQAALTAAPLQQILRDHLLAGITRKVECYQDYLFVMLHPKDNEHCRNAVAAYRACLADDRSFAVWTLEDVATCLQVPLRRDWVDLFIDRYLAFEKIDKRLVVAGGTA